MNRHFPIAPAVAVGLAVAILLLILNPGWLRPVRPVVQINETAPAVVSPGSGDSAPASYAKAVQSAAPAVVNVFTTKVVTQRVRPMFDDPILQRFFGDRFAAVPRKRLETSLGSGVIVSPQGYVLTNNHVISDASEILVALADGRTAQAQLVGSDTATDLAILKIDLEHLPTVTLGQSDQLQVGDVVLAIGNPYGVGQTVTQGIVSATGRTQLGINSIEDFIQTDAAINPGNSGGALINAQGQLIGVNTAIFSRTGGSQGIGFAIPISLAKGVMRQIIENGRVIRGWLGVELQDITADLAESFGLHRAQGAVIAGVYRGSPAERAGLEPGDVITAIDGRPIADSVGVMNRITQTQPGTAVLVDYLRRGKSASTRATLATAPRRP